MNRKNTLMKIVIFGSGGFGREVLWTINDCNNFKKKYHIMGFIDEKKSLHGKLIDKYPILGGVEWFSTKDAKDVCCVVAVGDSKIREKIVKSLEKLNVKFTTIIHPSVQYSNSIKFGTGTIIQAGSVITVDTTIGNHVHINMNSSIAHDCKINDYSTISPNVAINGNTIIEKGSFIGSGVTMKEGIKIGKRSVVGAGTVLIENVPENSLVVGVPGKIKTIHKKK